MFRIIALVTAIVLLVFAAYTLASDVAFAVSVAPWTGVKPLALAMADWRPWAAITCGLVLLIWRTRNRKLVAAAMLAGLFVGCVHAQVPASVASASGQQDGNPLVLLAAAMVTRTVQADPHFTAKDKADARNGLYDVAFRYARAEGLKSGTAREFASAFADNTAMPELACADFSTPPPDCR